MTVRIGVDLGGTKIEVVALDGDGTEVARRRSATPAGSYPDIIEAVVDIVRALEDEVGHSATTVGIGTPGAISPFEGTMKNSNTTALNGEPFDVDLAEALGRPLVMRNDADCFALSEATDGAAAGAAIVFGVIVGTGVGGGVVVDGTVRTGPNRIAGEWGHNPLPWPSETERTGPECYCGKLGCIEKWLAGPALSADHERVTGDSMSAPDIVTAARDGVASARDSIDRYADRMARSLATVIDILDPEVVVLGGGMSNVDELYTKVPARWADYVFGGEVATRLVRNHHGDSSGVRGAAMLVPT